MPQPQNCLPICSADVQPSRMVTCNPKTRRARREASRKGSGGRILTSHPPSCRSRSTLCAPAAPPKLPTHLQRGRPAVAYGSRGPTNTPSAARNSAQVRVRACIHAETNQLAVAVDHFGPAATPRLPNGGRRPCSTAAYARMRPINAPSAPRNIAQGRRREGIEQSNQPARLYRRPFRTKRNP